MDKLRHVKRYFPLTRSRRRRSAHGRRRRGRSCSRESAGAGYLPPSVRTVVERPRPPLRRQLQSGDGDERRSFPVGRPGLRRVSAPVRAARSLSGHSAGGEGRPGAAVGPHAAAQQSRRWTPGGRRSCRRHVRAPVSLESSSSRGFLTSHSLLSVCFFSLRQLRESGHSALAVDRDVQTPERVGGCSGYDKGTKDSTIQPFGTLSLHTPRDPKTSDTVLNQALIRVTESLKCIFKLSVVTLGRCFLTQTCWSAAWFSCT